MLEDYQNKVCVVTGAASGIGKALCEKLVALGAQVYALDRNKADIEGLSAFVETDLSDKGSIDAAFGVLPQVIDRFFGVAGLSGARTSYWLTFTVNFIANKYMTDTYLEKRIPSGGSIAYVTSCGGLMWEKWRKEYVKVMDCKTWDEMVAFMKSVSPKDGVGVMAYTLSKRAMNYYTSLKAVELPLAKLLPMTLEEMCEELRKRPGRGGNCIKETTVQKYLETVSSVLEDAKKNDIIPFNPAHRVRKKHFEKEVQHIPQKYEIRKLMQAIRDEPILYRAYYTLAITTGLRRGELCALQWRDITGACELTVRRSRSCASGKIVESDTKSHRERIVTIPMGIWELLMALRQQQVLHTGVPDREQPIFTDPDGHVPHPDSFTRHLRKLYKKCGLSEDYHLHTLRHFYATYLLQEGTSKQVAASLLGHADTAFLERTYCHPQDVAKQQAAKLMQDLLNNQNPCYVAFMKNRNRKVKKAG